MDHGKWKIKDLIHQLDEYKGSGTSMITLCIKAGSQIAPYKQKLVDEAGTASNIKSRVNKLSVLTALTSAQYALKKYLNTPPNGLVVFCGEAMDASGKQKKVNISFEPPDPILRSTYMCDSKFHTENLQYLLDDHDTYGYVIIDGNGCNIVTISGNKITPLCNFEVQLRNETRRGGQSALRFSRLRAEQVKNYVRKVCENMNTSFIKSDKILVSGIVMAGCGSKKDLVYESAILDPRLKDKVIRVLDIQYGKEQGLKEAISKSSEFISGLQLDKEAMIIGKFMDEINRDTGKYVFGKEQTLSMLEMGAVETVIVWEDCNFTIKNDESEDINIVRWLVDNISTMGATLEIVSDVTSVGNQFCKGFGGFGAILRWKVSSDSTPIEASDTEDKQDDKDNDFDIDDFF